MSVTSSPGQGTEIEAVIPNTTPERATSAFDRNLHGDRNELAWIQKSRIAGSMKPKLLLAEDHPAMRAMVASMLQQQFDVVASGANGQAALEAATKLLPDILILDVSMAILNGTDVAKRLKAQGCKAKIIFLSVSPDIDQIAACFAAGCVAMYRKYEWIPTSSTRSQRWSLEGHLFLPRWAEPFGQKSGAGEWKRQCIIPLE